MKVKNLIMVIAVAAIMFAGCEKMGNKKISETKADNSCNCSSTKLTIKSTEVLSNNDDMYAKFINSDLFSQLPTSGAKNALEMTVTTFNETSLRTVQYENQISTKRIQSVIVAYEPEEDLFYEPMILNTKQEQDEIIYDICNVDGQVIASINTSQNCDVNIYTGPRMDNCMRAQLQPLDDGNLVQWALFLINPPAYVLEKYASCAWDIAFTDKWKTSVLDR